MAVVSMNFLLEAGVHFGHQTKRWNPKMKEYIFGAREDIYIIDLEKTNALLEISYNELKNIAANGGKVLFVGTKKQASDVCVEEATRSKSYYVTERWLGGTLTNFRTIRRRVKRLEEIEEMEKNGTFGKLPKKEVIGLKKEYDKLNRFLCGIREMVKLPQALIIVDPRKEFNAIREAKKLNIPVFGLIDTNADPDVLDFVIPGNDDAVKSIKLIFGILNNAICEATGLEMVDYLNEEDRKGESKKESLTIDNKIEEVAEIEEKIEKPVSEKEGEIEKNQPTEEPTLDVANYSKEEDHQGESEKENLINGDKVEEKIEKPALEKEEKIEKPEKMEEKVVVEKPPLVKKPRTCQKKVDVEENKTPKKVVKEDLKEKNLTELKALAKQRGLKGYSTLKKNELIDMLNK